MKGKWGLIASGVLCAIGLAVSAVPVGAANTVLQHRTVCAQGAFGPNSADVTHNQYFPLIPGDVSVLSGKEGGQTITLQITVGGTQTVAGVATRAVEEREWADANANRIFDAGDTLIEVSNNFFAETTDTTVCYFGENVQNYDELGNPTDTAGTWLADYSTSFPGIYMPANPVRGTTFQQEDAPTAQDQGTIANAGKVKVPAGTYTNTIKVQEFNPLDGSRGSKIYGAGEGLIKDGPLSLYIP